jgi:polar amino acid transport system substrate-binding protein
MNRRNAVTIGAAILSALAVSVTPSLGDPRVADLVQAGKIRVALFPPQYAEDPATGALRPFGAGIVSMEIARGLARHLGVEVQLVGQPTPPKAVECVKTLACDVVIVGIEPSRAAEVDFSPPIIQFDYTYLVPAGSSIHAAADVDRPGIRIAVVRNHASTFALRRIVKHSELLDADIPDAAFELLRVGNVHAFASAREALVDYSVKLPGSKVLADAYGVNLVGMAVPKGQGGRLAYIREFIEEAKASGLIQRAIEGAGLRGVRVASPMKPE